MASTNKKNATKNTKSLSKNKAAKKEDKTKTKMNAKSATAAKPVVLKGASKPSATKKTAPVAVTKNKTQVLKPTAKAQTSAKAVTEKVQNKKELPRKEAVKVKGARRATENGYDSSICREVACELSSTTGGYCRMHYIKNWKRIKRKEVILKEKKLNSYIEELISKYPDKYIEAIRQDLASEKDFSKVIADLEIDEGGLDDFGDVETESAEGILENIKRDFDDEGDVF